MTIKKQYPTYRLEPKVESTKLMDKKTMKRKVKAISNKILSILSNFILKNNLKIINNYKSQNITKITNNDNIN